jgi:hypothetical protein
MFSGEGVVLGGCTSRFRFSQRLLHHSRLPFPTEREIGGLSSALRRIWKFSAFRDPITRDTKPGRDHLLIAGNFDGSTAIFQL